MEGYSGSKIRTVVVEDEIKILEHICRKIVELDDAFEIVGKAQNGLEAIELIERLRPQAVFTDISMPVMNGMEMIQKIRRLSPKTMIVIISGYSDFAYAQQAIRYGVSNYLLKPLENDLLIETLFDIKKNVFYNSTRKQRHMIYSDGYELISGKKEQFMLAVVCIGNVIYSVREEEVEAWYSEIMEKVSWRRVMEKMGRCSQWFVADDHVINQKVIVAKAESSHSSITVFAENILSALSEETEMPVTVCSLHQYVEQQEIWDYVKSLRAAIKRCLVVGKSGIIYTEKQGDDRELLEIIKMKMNQYVKTYFITSNMEHFLEELREIFRYMQRNNASQESVEKICLYAVKLLEFSEQEYDREVLDDLQNRILRHICMSGGEEELYGGLIRIFGTVSTIGKNVTEEEVDRIVSYINERYLSIESVETVADTFGYNYTYLSRMFKKKIGISMSRYILQKKLGLAKELLSRREELPITKVSELCGYTDYRYFSRVFKKETGVSPKEYRMGKEGKATEVQKGKKQ